MGKIKVELLDDCFRCEGDVPEQVQVPDVEVGALKVSKGEGKIEAGFDEDLEKAFEELLEG